MGTEDLDGDVNVDDDELGPPSPLSSANSPPGWTTQTLCRHDKQQQQHQQHNHHHHQPQVPVPHLSHKRRRKAGSVASGMSGGGGGRMFRDEMANLCELSLDDLMPLRTKCGRWLKHIELEIEERRQEQPESLTTKRRTGQRRQRGEVH